ncbi:MAG: glycosyltransferase family 2 protein [Ahniella sp.]|nr:glycosyltransferase family 2 protein [Ahniella sp.]
MNGEADPRRRLSVVVTTLDNAATLPALLAAVSFADELLVLDSGSSDATCAQARAAGARIETQPFLGYGPQKQKAIDLATHDWILLLDADETLSPELAIRIQREMGAPMFDAYRIARRERLFWRWQHPASKHNLHLRLFNRQLARMSTDPIHAAPASSGRVGVINEPLLHWGEPDIHTKVDKINRYSTGVAEERTKRAPPWLYLRLLVYPPIVTLKHLLLKRQLLNGWAGWINSVTLGYYSFLKDAKVLERRHQQKSDRA